MDERHKPYRVCYEAEIDYTAMIESEEDKQKMRRVEEATNQIARAILTSLDSSERARRSLTSEQKALMQRIRPDTPD